MNSVGGGNNKIALGQFLFVESSFAMHYCSSDFTQISRTISGSLCVSFINFGPVESGGFCNSRCRQTPQFFLHLGTVEVCSSVKISMDLESHDRFSSKQKHGFNTTLFPGGPPPQY